MTSISSPRARRLMGWQYERIDPDELQALKNENERLKAVETASKERPPAMDNMEVDQFKKQVCSTAPFQVRH